MPKGYKKDGSFAGIVFQKGSKINLGRKKPPLTKKWKRNISKGIKKNWKNKDFKEKMIKIFKNRIEDNNPNWKNGIRKQGGYILIYKPNHPYANKCGCVFQHRLVIEQYIGRYLKPEERVHHINEIKSDNRIENLMLFKNKIGHYYWHVIQKGLMPDDIVFDGRKK